MYHVDFGSFGATKLKATAGVKAFQQALKDRSVRFSLPALDPGKVDGKFGDKTRTALNAFRATMQQSAVSYPEMRDLDILGVDEKHWIDIITQAGAPREEIDLWINALSEEAAPPAEQAFPSVAMPGPAPSSAAEKMLAEQMAEEGMEPPAAAAAAAGGGKDWIQRNWKYLAVGGGVSLTVLLAAVLLSRRKAAAASPGLLPAPAVAGFGASKLKGIKPGKQICAAIVEGADKGYIRCGTVDDVGGGELQLAYNVNGGRAFAPVGEAWDWKAWAIPVTDKEARKLIEGGHAKM